MPIQLYADGPKEPTIYSGSLTLINIDNERGVGITCYHVIDKFMDLLGENEDTSLLIGGIELENALERIIDHGVSNDIAILDLSDLSPLVDFGLGITPQACVPPYWPPKPVSEGDITTLGGFPGLWREEKGAKHYEYFTFGIAGELVEDVRETSFKISLRDELHLKSDLGFKTANDLVHYGGLSGCPVFVQREFFLELVGIIRAGGDLFFEVTRLDIFDSNYQIFKLPEVLHRPVVLGR